MKIQRYNEKNLYAILFLWLMAIYHYCVITGFSAQPAAESAKESGAVVRQIVYLLTSFFNFEDTGKIFSCIEFTVRKLAHFTNFFILGFIYIMLAYLSCSGKSFDAAAAALFCGLAAAAIDEGHQYFIPGRSAEARDVCIDFAGVSVGCLIFIILRVIYHGEKK